MIRNLISRCLHILAFVGPGGGSIRPWLHRLRGVHIGKNVWISHFVYFDDCHPDHISIGDNCTIGMRTTIFAHLYWGARRRNHKDSVVIGNDVFIGPHCVILPNVKIGDGAVIKAGSVVSRNIPPHTLCGPPPLAIRGITTVPLTPGHSYEEFVRGIRGQTQNDGAHHERELTSSLRASQN